MNPLIHGHQFVSGDRRHGPGRTCGEMGNALPQVDAETVLRASHGDQHAIGSRWLAQRADGKILVSGIQIGSGSGHENGTMPIQMNRRFAFALDDLTVADRPLMVGLGLVQDPILLDRIEVVMQRNAQLRIGLA